MGPSRPADLSGVAGVVRPRVHRRKEKGIPWPPHLFA
jgi:hypothetical protein